MGCNNSCQGQTFEKAIIDLDRGSFAPGQTYVALSRVTTLDGLFNSKININDGRVIKILKLLSLLIFFVCSRNAIKMPEEAIKNIPK